MSLVGCDAADTDSTPPSVEYQLAAIHGDTSKTAEFGRLLDRIQKGSDICDPEPSRTRVGDVMVASWEQSGKGDTLLEWAQALASVCG